VNEEAGGLGKFDHPFNKLGAITANRRTAIEVNEQFIEVWIMDLIVFPLSNQTIDDEITGFRRLSQVNRYLVSLGIQNAKWD
jgi:hypothetical protein